MRIQEHITSSTKAPNGFQHTTDKYLLCFPCIITIDNIVDVGGLYDLVDFGDNGEINVTKVKFLEAYTTGYRVTIVVLNIKTGEILKRSHRIDNDTLPCHWVLTDLFTKPLPEEVLLNDSHDSN